MRESIRNFILSRIGATKLKDEFFILILRISTLSTVVFAILAAILKKSRVSIYTYIGMLVFLLLVYYVKSKFPSKTVQKSLYTIFCVGMNGVFLPLLYVTAGGIASGMPLFFIIGGVATIILLDNLFMLFILALNGFSFLAAYYMEYHWPDLIPSFTNLGQITYIDISLSTICVGVGAGIALRTLVKNFDSNQVKAKELLKQLEESSTKDPLTGAYNRRFLMEYLYKCIAQVENGEIPTFALLMFDIDHFKNVNDTYGHLAGDDCIKNLAYILKKSLRNVDIVSRYGGEEFICVLPTADETPAFRRAEQIRSSVEISQLSEDIDRKITVSGGVAMYLPGMTPEALISAVDENLYVAKENGRNQVVWHKGGIPPLCYVAYDADPVKLAPNAGRRFTDQSMA